MGLLSCCHGSNESLQDERLQSDQLRAPYLSDSRKSRCHKILPFIGAHNSLKVPRFLIIPCTPSPFAYKKRASLRQNVCHLPVTTIMATVVVVMTNSACCQKFTTYLVIYTKPHGCGE